MMITTDNLTLSEALEEITNPAALPCQKHHHNWQCKPQKTENRNLNHYFTLCQYLRMRTPLCPAFDNLLYSSSVSSDKTQQRELKYMQYPLEHLSFFSFCDVKCSPLKYWRCNRWASCHQHTKRRTLLPAALRLSPCLVLCITEVPKVTRKQSGQHRNSFICPFLLPQNQQRDVRGRCVWMFRAPANPGYHSDAGGEQTLGQTHACLTCKGSWSVAHHSDAIFLTLQKRNTYGPVTLARKCLAYH